MVAERQPGTYPSHSLCACLRRKSRFKLRWKRCFWGAQATSLQQPAAAPDAFAQTQTDRSGRFAASCRELQASGLCSPTMSKIDKAVLLAAGRGTRMRELTTDLPKPMIEVRGKSVLQQIVEGLRDAGVRKFLIIVGYRADSV